jgi:hypothetical protein
VERFVRAVTFVAGVFMLVFGLWAFLAPRSFASQIATFPPYNVHLIHDVGAFQSGLGATLLFALVRADALTAVLSGASVGAVLHVIAHIEDRSRGGRSTDPVGLAILAIAIVAAAVARARAPAR